jgi:LytR cell envelope-related transcriptional attenuator
MKQTKPSHAAVQTDTSDISRERVPKLQTRRAHYSKLMKVVVSVLSLAFIITVYVLAHRSFSNHSATIDPLPSSTAHMLEIEVLDGAGNMKAAQYVTNVLRSQKYDVVEMKRNNEGMIERTYVIDRSGNLEATQKLATALGIAHDKVFQKIDRNLFLDVTVVVGKDFSRLKVFQELNERNKR